MKTLQAGFATVDITPRGGCDINGFIARKQPALGVRKAVMGRVLVLQVERWRGVVAVCDLLGFTLKDSLTIEGAIARAARVPVKNVLLACTHTHSAPVSMPLGTVGRVRREYVATIKTKLARAAREAAADAAPVEDVRFATGDASEFGSFRCATREPGRSHWPGRFAVLRIERSDAAPILLLHLGLHPYVLGPKNRYVHPDYPGNTCDELERRTGGRALFVPGCGADVMPQPPGADSPAAVARFGRKLAGRVLASLRRSRCISLGPARSAVLSPIIRYGWMPPGARKVNENEPAIQAQRGADERARRNLREWLRGLRQGTVPASLPFRTHVMRLGDVVLVGMPAELFWDTGTDLAHAVRGATVLTVSHAGGDVGYLPRPFAYKHRTYECASAHQWYRTAGAALPGSEAALRKAAARKARRLLGGSSR